MARTYGWQMGMTSEDLICVLSSLVLGFTDSPDPSKDMADAFFPSNYKSSIEKTISEVGQMCFLKNGKYQAILISPLHKIALPPDTIVLLWKSWPGFPSCPGCHIRYGRKDCGDFWRKGRMSRIPHSPHDIEQTKGCSPGTWRSYLLYDCG